MSIPVLLWADVETDGLGPDAHLLEIGLRTTDDDLNTLAEQSWVLPYHAAVMASMRSYADPVVQAMHDTSGLWVECVQQWDATPHRVEAGVMRETYWHRDIAAEILAWVQEYAPGHLPLAGSSVRADRDWLTGFIPGLDGLLHYRIVDVSTVKILLNMWWPDRSTYSDVPAPARRHRVLPDLDDSIAELAFYRRVLGLGTAAATA